MGHREDMLDVIKRAYVARGDGDGERAWWQLFIPRASRT